MAKLESVVERENGTGISAKVLAKENGAEISKRHSMKNRESELWLMRRLIKLVGALINRCDKLF